MVHLSTQYLYDDPNLAVSAVSGALSQSGRPFAHGFEFYLERATLSFEFANLGGQGHLATPLSVILPDGTVERPDLRARATRSTPSPPSWPSAVGAVASGTPSPMLSGDLARQALKTLPRRGRVRRTRSDGRRSNDCTDRCPRSDHLKNRVRSRPMQESPGDRMSAEDPPSRRNGVMSTLISELVHPTAVISPEADLAADVQVGPYSIIEGPVRVGPGRSSRGMPASAGRWRWAATTSSATAPCWARARSTRAIGASRPRSGSATATSSASTSPSTGGPSPGAARPGSATATCS